MRDGEPVLMRLPEINFIDDKAGKPVGIHQHIGRRPIAAFGNSDGDLQMLQWTCRGPARASASTSTTPMRSANGPMTGSPHIGRLDKGLDEAAGERLDGGRHEGRLEARCSRFE